jgi:acetoacetyl-CoA reductase
MSQRKVALVIDGMSALGTAICRRLQRDGLVVVAGYPVHQRQPDAWLAAQRDEGGTFSAWRTDAGAFDDCAALVGKVLGAHGRLDVLVNLGVEPGEDAGAASGPGDGASLDRMEASHWHAGLRGVHAAFNMNKHALPPMLERQWGRIIHVAHASAWPLPGRPLAASHAAGIAALHGLTRALALETARHGVTVNTVMPGFLRHHDGVAAVAEDRAVAAHIPVGRRGEATEVAALVAYLASESAGFVTGAQIAINGGQHMM